MSEKNSIRIDHDDSVVDIIDKMNRILSGSGARLVDDGQDHDGYVVLRLVKAGMGATVTVDGRPATGAELDAIALASLTRPPFPPCDVEMPAEDVIVRGGMAYARRRFIP